MVAIDLSRTLTTLARERLPADLGPGRILFLAGDMLDPQLGPFDHVVAMDSLIHYQAGDIVEALASLAGRTRHSMVFTFAPRTPLLAAMHAVGRLFPRGDRAPAIEPVAESTLRTRLAGEPRLADWRPRRTERVECGFYKSQALEIGDAMTQLDALLARGWTRLGSRFLPFADAATSDLPLRRLLRLSLFQVSVGMATALLVGTLNRVMIVELGVAAALVSTMVALPLLFAPLRALVGFRSDTHRSLLGWRRVPYLWLGHAGAVRRARDHALRAARAVRRGPRTGVGRARWRGASPSCSSAPASRPRRPPASRWPPTSPAGRAPARRGAAVRHAADRHAGQRLRVRVRCSRSSARCG